MIKRFMRWLRPSGLPLWVHKRFPDGSWAISFNEGNFPNFCIRPGFFYVGVWLRRPFRWHWMSKEFRARQQRLWDKEI